MSILVAYRREVERVIRAGLPAGPEGVRDVATHIGEFTENELKRYAIRAPAVVLAPLGCTEIDRKGGMTAFTMKYAAFIVTKSMTADDRGDIALAIIEAIGKIVVNHDFGDVCAKAGTNVDAGNLYTSKTDEMGVSLWAVRWQQVVQAQTDDTSNLAEFLTMDATYNLDDVDDPDDFDAHQIIKPQE